MEGREWNRDDHESGSPSLKRPPGRRSCNRRVSKLAHDSNQGVDECSGLTAACTLQRTMVPAAAAAAAAFDSPHQMLLTVNEQHARGHTRVS